MGRRWRPEPGPFGHEPEPAFVPATGDERATAEFVARVAQVRAEITAAGGLGTRVSCRTPDGLVHVGELVEGSTRDQGPYVRDADGKMWQGVLLPPP